MLATGTVEVDHRHVPARPGARDGVEPDRRRPARASPSRTSRCCTATPRSRPRAWTPTARARSSSAARRWCWPPTRSSRRPGRSRRTCSRPAPTTSSSPVAGSRSRAPTRASAITDIALATFAAHNLPDGVEPSIDADATYDPVDFSFPHGTHLCAMEVDTETGATTMRKYVCVDDIGKIINPLIVEGQVHGGLVQGIAQALWEGAEYDDQGTLVTGLVRRLHPADRGRHDQLRHRAHDLAVDDEHARHQGRRRGRHHRLDPGRRQRHRRRRAPPRRQRRPDAVHARTGVEGDPDRRSATPARSPGRRSRTSRTTPSTRTPQRARRTERHSDPRSIRLPGPHHRRRGPRGARRGSATTPR